MNPRSNRRTRRRRRRFVVVPAAALAMLVLVGMRLALPGSVSGAPRALSASAFGQSLADWQATYWPWYYGATSPVTDGNGNAVVGNTVLMPLPNAPGDGTPGSIELSLNAGQSFFLPLWGLVGNSYIDGSVDPAVDLDVFRTLEITVKVDGVTVIDDDNVMNYYSQGDLVPPVPFDFPPADAFVWFQSIGMTHTPLTPGQHTITLDVANTQPVYGLFTFEYHNTWNITVNRGR